MAAVATDKAFQSRMQELEGLLQEIEAIADPAVRAKMGQIIQTLLEFHGAGLTAIFDRMADAGELGRAAIEDLSRDELVGSLLLLYDLHPLNLECGFDRPWTRLGQPWAGRISSNCLA